ncbi:hypothetical protein BJ741DRAFT_346307 [Chytriomyces cf. hyalinus JEL632]|nr:hypothetical protein BJ741DRAFT_346307 [Chytriomyces cf. hyalinus JEL632]
MAVLVVWVLYKYADSAVENDAETAVASVRLTQVCVFASLNYVTSPHAFDLNAVFSAYLRKSKFVKVTSMCRASSLSTDLQDTKSKRFYTSKDVYRVCVVSGGNTLVEKRNSQVIRRLVLVGKGNSGRQT